MTVFGVAIAYLLNSLSTFVRNHKKNQKKLIVPSLAIVSSLYIAFLCFRNIFLHGLSFAFSSIFLLGIIIHIAYKRN
jgi:hypothetical protein